MFRHFIHLVAVYNSALNLIACQLTKLTESGDLIKGMPGDQRFCSYLRQVLLCETPL